MIAVRIRPAIIPKIGLENTRRKFLNSGTSANGFTASDMVSIPNISTENPIIMVAAFLYLSFLENNKKPTPIMARTGEKDVGFNNCMKKLSLSIPVSPSNHEVMVVPILAPMMTPMALDSFIIPELTNPTTMTVVAEED